MAEGVADRRRALAQVAAPRGGNVCCAPPLSWPLGEALSGTLHNVHPSRQLVTAQNTQLCAKQTKGGRGTCRVAAELPGGERVLWAGDRGEQCRQEKRGRAGRKFAGEERQEKEQQIGGQNVLQCRGASGKCGGERGRETDTQPGIARGGHAEAKICQQPSQHARSGARISKPPLAVPAHRRATVLSPLTPPCKPRRGAGFAVSHRLRRPCCRQPLSLSPPCAR